MEVLTEAEEQIMLLKEPRIQNILIELPLYLPEAFKAQHLIIKESHAITELHGILFPIYC